MATVDDRKNAELGSLVDAASASRAPAALLNALQPLPAPCIIRALSGRATPAEGARRPRPTHGSSILQEASVSKTATAQAQVAAQDGPSYPAAPTPAADSKRPLQAKEQTGRFLGDGQKGQSTSVDVQAAARPASSAGHSSSNVPTDLQPAVRPGSRGGRSTIIDAQPVARPGSSSGRSNVPADSQPAVRPGSRGGEQRNALVDAQAAAKPASSAGRSSSTGDAKKATRPSSRAVRSSIVDATSDSSPSASPAPRASSSRPSTPSSISTKTFSRHAASSAAPTATPCSSLAGSSMVPSPLAPTLRPSSSLMSTRPTTPSAGSVPAGGLRPGSRQGARVATPATNSMQVLDFGQNSSTPVAAPASLRSSKVVHVRAVNALRASTPNTSSVK